MKKTYRITLNADDLGQMLDGLRLRADSWRKTADYLESGCHSDELFIIEECNDAAEARRIFARYEHLVSRIEEQVARQGGWL